MSVAELWRSRSLEDAAAYANEADPRDLCDTLADMTGAHEATFERSLDLVGSHGLMSPRARAMLGTGLIDQMRQAGLPGNRVHAGSYWIDRIETVAVALAKRLFGVAYAELRPLSCALANGFVFAALARRGDKILAQTRYHGADPSTMPDTFGELFGHEFADLPYDETRFTVDVERAVEAIPPDQAAARRHGERVHPLSLPRQGAEAGLRKRRGQNFLRWRPCVRSHRRRASTRTPSRRARTW